MEIFGIINQSLVPVRKHLGDASEMINQLIYGELVLVKDKINTWLLIESLHDKYEGWIDEKQLKQLSTAESDQLSIVNQAITRSIMAKAHADKNQQPLYLTMGSRLFQFNNQLFNNFEGEYLFSGKIFDTTGHPTGEQIVEVALSYMHAPYLWGGRSVWGIDCSGLVQMAFLLHGIHLPRDAADQSLKGELVDFIHETRPGDLAFFDNQEEKIIHVGIVLSNNQLIHASGKVRIDTLDHQGIFNSDLNKYTHKLRLIRRLV